MKGEGNNWSRAALVVAHPSHELRVHGWMQTARPHVFVLTDGSGRISEPRLQRTTRVLEEVGARPASIYGRVKDLDVYDALIKLNFPFFIQLAQELAEEFERQQKNFVSIDLKAGHHNDLTVNFRRSCRYSRGTDACAASGLRSSHQHRANYSNPKRPEIATQCSLFCTRFVSVAIE